MMKKVFLLIVLVIITNCVWSQNYIVTPNGLRSSVDNEKSYLVLSIESVDASTLYKNAMRYINEMYNNPKEVIVGSEEGAFLKFKTYSSDFINYSNSGVEQPIVATYITSLKFKDNKVRYEIENLNMENKTAPEWKVMFSGGMFRGYIIYKKNGKLFKESAKRDIEEYFKQQVSSLMTYLKGENKSEEW